MEAGTTSFSIPTATIRDSGNVPTTNSTSRSSIIGKGNTRQVEIDGSTRVQYVEYRHGVWKNAMMTEDGAPHDWMPCSELRRRRDIVPRVPLEMRWYLTRLGILDDAGVNKLRPLTAWWIG